MRLPQPLPSACVLVVDDHEAKRYLCASALRRESYTVWEATDGEQALRLAEAQPDLIVLDVRLPGMDGFEVLRRLKASTRTAAIPVLQVSASFTEPLQRVRGLEGGAAGYLVSPDGEELTANVRMLLRARALEHEHAQLLAREREARREADESRERLRCLVEASAQVVWTTAPTGEVVAPSASWQAFTGQSAPEALGWGWLQVLHPEDRACVEEAWREAVARGAPYRGEYRLWCAARQHYAFSLARGVPVHGPDGLLREWVCANSDVTEHKSAEVALRLQARVLHGLGEGVSIADEEGAILFANPAEEAMAGCGPGELVGRPLAAHAPEEALAQLRTQGHWAGEWSSVRADGTDRVTRAHLTALHSEGKSYWVCVRGDVTAQRQHEAVARQTSEFEQQLIGIVSHDLRTPLSAIFLGAARVLRAPGLEDGARLAAERILAAAQRSQRMISDLLDFTQARLGGGIRIARAQVDLHTLVGSLLDELRQAYPQRTLTLASEGEDRCALDADRIAQVLTNLVGNALQHGAADAPVHVRTQGSEDAVVLEVHNRGTPIPLPVQQTLFDPFRQGDAALRGHASRRGSIGLGLYISRAIVQAHGGELEVCSALESGTTFRVRLPR